MSQLDASQPSTWATDRPMIVADLTLCAVYGAGLALALVCAPHLGSLSHFGWLFAAPMAGLALAAMAIMRRSQKLCRTFTVAALERLATGSSTVASRWTLEVILGGFAITLFVLVIVKTLFWHVPALWVLETGSRSVIGLLVAAALNPLFKGLAGWCIDRDVARLMEHRADSPIGRPEPVP